MGQHLSCVSKNRAVDIGPKKSKKKKNAIDDDLIEPKNSEQQKSAVSIKPVLLEAAPSSFALPAAASAFKKAKGGNQIEVSPPVSSESKRPSSELLNGIPRPHKQQPVDGHARQLAQGVAKPVCWKDLYWHLIGSRGYKTNEEKVRALFTWICSIPLNEGVFATVTDTDDTSKRTSKEKLKTESPDVILPKLSEGTANYVQAFESMCRYSGIPSITIRGIAKSMEYKVGQTMIEMDEPLFNPETGALSPKIASLQHSWNAAYVDGSWRLYDCTWAAQRLAMRANPKSAQAVMQQYELDMFYYQVHPTEIIFTHYPFDDVWQMIDPPVSIVSFATWPLLKPAFFQYGLSLFSHQDGTLNIESQLVLKIKMLPECIDKLLFTYQLHLDGFGNIDDSNSKTRFGIHETSAEESCEVFRFRLPKKGDYNLIIYARNSGEQLFSDVCEYKIRAKGQDTNDGPVSILPFPPTAQASYGPTEKAALYGLETLPRGLSPLVKSTDGTLELRFVAAEPEGAIPRLTARLKSLTVKADILENCVLQRNIEASIPTTGVSVLTGTGPCVPMSVVNAYLPEPGEYALEVYAAPAESDDASTYHLSWQFLIEAEAGKPLSTSLLSRLATINLGPQDETWQNLGFRALSHPDPLIRVRTSARAGAEGLLKATSKSQILQRFMGCQVSNLPAENSSQPLDQSSEEEDKGLPVTDREACDLQIVIGLPDQQKICLISQLVEISSEEEEDVTSYMLQKVNKLEAEEFEPGNRLSTLSREIPSQLVHLLIRIPRGGAFYKLYLYGVKADKDITSSIPLIYTYFIDAPLRLSSAEAPYLGATAGEFPEKIEKRKAAEETAANKTSSQTNGVPSN